MKEEKVGELLKELNKVMTSFETQLSCSKCMNLLDEPTLLLPCAHIVCKKHSQDARCPQCSRAVKDRNPMTDGNMKDLVSKYEYTKDLLETF